MRKLCVIGLGQFGTHLARKLVDFGCEVLVIDRNEERVEALRDDVHRAVIGDARSITMLRNVLGDGIDEAIIAMGDTGVEASILCALNLKKIGIERIVSTASNDDHAEILEAVGAQDIIFPERDSAERAARRVANPGLRDMFSLEGDFRIMELVAPPKLHGRKLGELNLRSKFDVLILAVREPNAESFRFLPSADTMIHPEESLMVLGRELDLVQFADWR